MIRLSSSFRSSALLALVVAFASLVSSNAFAQFTETSLVTTTQDPNLKNAWGLTYFGANPFWVSNEASGTSTLYDESGTIIPLVVTIPSATGTGKGSPTGIAANTTTGFVIHQNGHSAPAVFIFDTLDGTISGWNSGVNANSAVVVVNNHTAANYTGLTINTTNGHTFIYAANEAKNQIEVYNSSWKLVKTFTDATLTGMSVYGVQAINGQIYVTFSGASGAAVDIFSPTGTRLKTLIKSPSTGRLRGPWGLALAPSNFDTLSGALLVGNVDDGKINGFNATTGKFIATLRNKSGVPIVNPGLWGMVFGGGKSTNGNTNELFITAGTGGYSTGLFAKIDP